MWMHCRQRKICLMPLYGKSAATPVISSRTNTRVKQLRAAFVDNLRLSGGWVAIEGDNLLAEALRSGLMLKTVFVSERHTIPDALPPDTEVLRLTGDVFASAAGTRTPQGIAALVEPPVASVADVLRRTPLILIAAGLQDPGNLGTLVRSAEAFGATAVFSTQGTVSVWNQKALRASAGSVFRVPVVDVTSTEIGALKGRGVRLLAAVGSGGTSAQDIDFTGSCALMIGNEGSGLGSEWLEMADALVTIPCPGPVESLNAAVAGSLLLYETSRQRSMR